MKKTIAILALAAGFSSVTMAETITMGPEQLIGEPSTPLTLTAVLNTVQLKQALMSGTTAEVLTLINTNSNATLAYENKTVLAVKNNGLTGTWASYNAGTNAWNDLNTGSWGFGMDNLTSTDIWYGAAASALTLIGSTNANNLNGTVAIFSIVYHDGHIEHFGGDNTGLKFTGGERGFVGYQFNSTYVDYKNGPTYNFDSYNSAADAIAAAKKLNETRIAHLAPEPTTATLSLLALAGLAARRRRK